MDNNWTASGTSNAINRTLDSSTFVTEMVAYLTSIVKALQNIFQSTVQFVDSVVSEQELKYPMFAYVISMLLYSWTHGQHLQPLLDGLQKQTIVSVHAYFCSDLPVLHDTTQFDPYKSVSDEIKKICDTKPKTCRVCKKVSVFTYVSAQTRSADEGMTTFVTCSLCGARN